MAYPSSKTRLRSSHASDIPIQKGLVADEELEGFLTDGDLGADEAHREKGASIQRRRSTNSHFWVVIVGLSVATIFLWWFRDQSIEAITSHTSSESDDKSHEEPTDGPIFIHLEDTNDETNNFKNVTGNSSQRSPPENHSEFNMHGANDGKEASTISNESVETTATTTTLPSSYPSYSPTHILSTVQNPTYENTQLMEKWGNWKFYDGSEELRPSYDYLSNYTNQDCPEEDFPEHAWQADAVYMNHFLDASSDLINRAKEAIYTEYGLGKEVIEKMKNGYAQRKQTFHIDYIDLESMESELFDAILGKVNDNLGWTTHKSFQGLTKRLLHAMMTNDDFTVVVVGDASAAGYGNHFSQSFAIQFHQIMKPIFKRLGVNLVTRNLSNGKANRQDPLGPGLASLGENIDVLLWDEEEPSENHVVGFFLRQALIRGDYPPLLMGGSNEVLRQLHMDAGVEIFQLGSGLAELPISFNETQAQSLPWSLRYLKCKESDTSLCEKEVNRYQTTCWVHRNDYEPVTPQLEHIDHRENTFPGYRHHKLKGRVLAFVTLLALEDAIDTWGEVTQESGHPLMGEHWHITDHYNSIQSKFQDMDSSIGMCHVLEKIPKRLCSVPLTMKTESTPRSDINNSGIVSVVRGGESLSKVHPFMAYSGPNQHNPSLDMVQGELDVKSIVSNRRGLMHDEFSAKPDSDIGIENYDKHGKKQRNVSPARRTGEGDKVMPGAGWLVDSLPGQCDGTEDAICGRLPTSNCLLSGYMDYEGGLIGNGTTGWLVFDIDGAKYGIVILKLRLQSNANDHDVSSTETNNCFDHTVDPDEIMLDYAIGDSITPVSRQTLFNSTTQGPGSKTDVTMTILDDPNLFDGTTGLNVGLRLKPNIPCEIRLTAIIYA